MLSQGSGPNHVFLFSRDHGWFFSEQRGHGQIPRPYNMPLICHLSPGIDGHADEPGVWKSVLDAIRGWNQRKGCRAPEYQGWSQRRVNSIFEGYQIRECTAPEYRGRSRRRGVMTRYFGKIRKRGSKLWILDSWFRNTQVSRAKPKTECSCEAPGYHGRSFGRRIRHGSSELGVARDKAREEFE